MILTSRMFIKHQWFNPGRDQCHGQGDEGSRNRTVHPPAGVWDWEGVSFLSFSTAVLSLNFLSDPTSAGRRRSGRTDQRTWEPRTQYRIRLILWGQIFSCCKRKLAIAVRGNGCMKSCCVWGGLIGADLSVLGEDIHRRRRIVGAGEGEAGVPAGLHSRDCGEEARGSGALGEEQRELLGWSRLAGGVDLQPATDGGDSQEVDHGVLEEPESEEALGECRGVALRIWFPVPLPCLGFQSLPRISCKNRFFAKSM